MSKNGFTLKFSEETVRLSNCLAPAIV